MIFPMYCRHPVLRLLSTKSIIILKKVHAAEVERINAAKVINPLQFWDLYSYWGR